jgi:tetratricopeptide (TPR) repeat protein
MGKMQRFGEHADRFLVALFGIVAFLLGCHQLRFQDGDIWWHLRTGAWILEHGQVPFVDPFTFGSQGEPWIDLHWLFQIGAFCVHRAAGVAGLVFVTGVLSAAATIVGLCVRPAKTPAWIAILLWFPALLIAAMRLPVRPETLTLLFTVLFFWVLFRLDEHPRYVWVLVPVQLLWVNTHGLFVFGPILLAMRLAERLAYQAGQVFSKRSIWTPDDLRWWRHVGGASLVVVVVCFLNPYGPRGTVFPLVLYPKVTEANNVYKQHVREFARLKEIAATSPENFVRQSPYWAMHFLLLLLPASFLLPALTEATARLSTRRGEPARVASGVWLAAFIATIILLAISTYTLHPYDCPGWLRALGKAVPLLLGTAGIIGGVGLALYSRYAAVLSAVGGVALASWIAWLNDYLMSGTTPPARSPVYWLISGAITVAMIMRVRRCLFAILLAVAFCYLAIAGINSVARFGLAAGVILSWNLTPWLGGLVQRLPVTAIWSIRAGLACVLVAWSVVVVSNRLPAALSTGSRFGFQEQPLQFAHDAIRFTGQDGMPERALVYPIRQTPLYTYYNAPERQTFIDPRLEVPSERTFLEYLAIEQILVEAQQGWPKALHELGDPVLFLANDDLYTNAQAAVLAHPDWRLVYYDAMAAVFLRRSHSGLESRFPTLDLAARHFENPKGPSEPADPRATWKEANALTQLALALYRDPNVEWEKSTGVLLHALDRVELAFEQDSPDDRAWLMLSNCYWGFVLSMRSEPPATDRWMPETCLSWAQSTYCLRRALDYNPGNRSALGALYRSLAARRLLDAQRAIGQRLLELGKLPRELTTDIEQLTRGMAFGRQGVDFDILLRLHRPAEAVDLALAALEDGKTPLSWELTERLASAAMHIGRPADARRLWLNAQQPPSEALRLCRLGDTKWVERDYDAAIADYEQSRRLDPSLLQPCWALAWIQAQRGVADRSLPACQAALARNPTHSTRAALQSLESLVRIHVKRK